MLRILSIATLLTALVVPGVSFAGDAAAGSGRASCCCGGGMPLPLLAATLVRSGESASWRAAKRRLLPLPSAATSLSLSKASRAAAAAAVAASASAFSADSASSFARRCLARALASEAEADECGSPPCARTRDTTRLRGRDVAAFFV